MCNLSALRTQGSVAPSSVSDDRGGKVFVWHHSFESRFVCEQVTVFGRFPVITKSILCEAVSVSGIELLERTDRVLDSLTAPEDACDRCSFVDEGFDPTRGSCAGSTSYRSRVRNTSSWSFVRTCFQLSFGKTRPWATKAPCAAMVSARMRSAASRLRGLCVSCFSLFMVVCEQVVARERRCLCVPTTGGPSDAPSGNPTAIAMRLSNCARKERVHVGSPRFFSIAWLCNVNAPSRRNRERAETSFLTHPEQCAGELMISPHRFPFLCTCCPSALRVVQQVA